MAYYPPQQQNPYGAPNPAQNLQFYSSQYPSQPVSGQSTPFQAFNSQQQVGYGGQPPFGGGGGMGFGGFSAPGGVSGRMGEQGGLRTGWIAAFGTEGYDGEPPLLEELGINFGHISTKTLTVLNPMARIDQHIMDDSDLAGPVLFFFLFGTFLLFSGKVHFGYIYGLAVMGAISLHYIISLMTPELDPSVASVPPPPPHMSSASHQHLSSTLTLSRSASVLGYCLLPLVLTSLVGIVVPMDTLFGYIATSLAIAWCTVSSSAMFTAVGGMRDMRALVAYPLFLFYVGFGIMAIFSSRGTGQLAATTGKAGA
ncbi:MAG: hypothetical protein M1828_005800 [Chrysothrix sp. TS-e1954]|nr:MAG: hypothetical protein M1828_005800 [Chrysothrix sp. TS-e1954]